MTMHLVGPYMTTTVYNRKQKKTKSKRMIQAQEDHDKWLAKMGVGKTKLPTDKKGNRTGIYDIPDYKTERVTSDRIAGNGFAKKPVKYTGNEIAGIVVTHKSNLMPVRKDNKQAAIDAANMRRG